ncbi:hypothetical protein P775_06440 [Puniceibacterium antarcticum]|uniref:Uncharacterized protein n=1 Tax=Puniceibacterium antarcticum TaxID=1206336 RepID=A0A2G8RHP4_9RHOB|nr:hypothetical protein [Puniceibacterium antarcticum]PIL21003.1 hypothetical protein P775_06440 [Puniceibacterium antarcticum]
MSQAFSRRLFLAAGAAAALPRVGHAADGTILMRDLYNKDLSFSDIALAQEGSRIDVAGFMAPPLKAEMAFFVLTKRPMATCPFCESSADWPDDILAIYTKRVVDVAPFNVPLVVSGVLELGTHTDDETGFVSRIRLSDARYARA